MELFRIIKRDAANALRFCGGRAVASVMIVALAYLAINLTETFLLLVFSGAESLFSDFYSLSETSPEVLAVTGGAAAVYALVLPALCLGYVKLHLSFAEGKDESISVLFDMFSSFKKFFGSVVFALLYTIRHFIAFAVALVPGAAFFYFAETYIPEGSRTLDLLKICACCISISIMLLCAALALIFVQRWALAPYYRVSGKSIHKSFALSVNATKDIRTRMLGFRFSFAPWALLSVFVLPLLWTVPYYFISEAIFSKYLMERYERSLAETPDFFEDEVTGQEKG